MNSHHGTYQVCDSGKLVSPFLESQDLTGAFRGRNSSRLNANRDTLA